MKGKCCSTCKHSRWWLTPSGRIKRKAMGQCKVVVPVMQPLPVCITKAYGYNPELHRTRVSQDDGADCPLYELNEGKPIKEGMQ